MPNNIPYCFCENISEKILWSSISVAAVQYGAAAAELLVVSSKNFKTER